MSSLREFLSEHHYPLQLDHQSLIGPGAAFLQARAQEARFMLLGEEHGVGSNLAFATALFQTIHPFGYKTYVTEIGPISAANFNQYLHTSDPQAAFEAFFREYPFAVPFAWWQEERALYQAVRQAASEQEAPLIGVDQEFILSPQCHLKTLWEQCADPGLQARLGAWLDLERQANRALARGTSPDQLITFMNQALPDAWEALRQHFATHAQADALAIMDALQVSHQIYMFYKHEQYYENNQVRSEWMRSYFYTAYQKQMAAWPDSRFFIKLGANHVSRGHTTMGILDLGNFIAELAYIEGTKSFHLLVLPLSGTLNAWLPFLPEAYKAHPIDGDYGPGVAHLLEAVPSKTGWNLYDLRPFRQRQNYWAKEQPAFKELFLRYDAVLLMEDVHAARFLEDERG